MAKILVRPSGQRRIQFYLHGKRGSLSLGKITDDEANEVYGHFRVLLEARKKGREPKRSTQEWVSEQTPTMLKRLIRAGLVDAPEQPAEQPEPERETLKGFIDRFIESRTDIKPRTRDIFERTRDSLVIFFGADKVLEDITIGHAREFERWL